MSDPYPVGSYVDNKFGSLLFIDGTDPFDYSGGYEIDGMPVSASEFARLAEAGALQTENPGDMVNGMAGPKHPATRPVIPYGLGVFGVFVPDGGRDNDLQYDLRLFGPVAFAHHHASVSGAEPTGEPTATPCDVKLPNDEDQREIVVTVMGEMTRLGSSQYGTDQHGRAAVRHASGSEISNYDSYREAAYMLSAIENRHRDWNGGKSSYSQIVNAPGQFRGHGGGVRDFANLGTNDSEPCLRARIILSAMEDVLSNGVWNTSIYYWRGVEQWPENGDPPFVRTFRPLLDTRIANTDFMQDEPPVPKKRRG